MANRLYIGARYVPLPFNNPDVPTSQGTYTLKAVRTAAGITYSWVSG